MQRVLFAAVEDDLVAARRRVCRVLKRIICGGHAVLGDGRDRKAGRHRERREAVEGGEFEGVLALTLDRRLQLAFMV